MPSARAPPRMMGRIAAVAVLVALLAPLAPAAGSADPRAFSGHATPCHPLQSLNAQDQGLCPRVRHAGTLAPGACEGASCALAVTVDAHAQGVPTLRKTLLVDVALDGVAQGAPVCEATNLDATLACSASGAPLLVTLAEGACAQLRVRSLFRDAADAPLVVLVQADSSFEACREGGVLTLG